MAGNRTLTIIKPDAFGSGKAGKIIAHLEAAGFRIAAARVTHLTEAEAGAFYEVHRERPFYRSLVTFMRPALREQWLLAVPAFAQCRVDCKGLCPTCGADLNAGACDCAPVTDSRWDTLRKVRGQSN